jgi:hypothetical protein
MEGLIIMEEIKQIVSALLNEFAKEEHGNRVTNNNMFALGTKIAMAFDGKITLQKPEDKPEKE